MFLTLLFHSRPIHLEVASLDPIDKHLIKLKEGSVVSLRLVEPEVDPTYYINTFKDESNPSSEVEVIRVEKLRQSKAPAEVDGVLKG